MTLKHHSLPEIFIRYETSAFGTNANTDLNRSAEYEYSAYKS